MTTEPTRTSHRAVAIGGRVALAVAALLALAALAAPAALAADAIYEGSSADGKVVVFSTTEKLVPGDTDNKKDVYERSFSASAGEYVTREVSTGPTGGNNAIDANFDKISADGTKVFFETEERLVAADTDSKTDVYVRELTPGGTTRLVSVAAAECGPSCGNGPAATTFVGATGGGEVALFVTTERMAAADQDSITDIYARDLASESTTMVSAGATACSPACGNENFAATVRGASADGSKAYFDTLESLDPADTDTALDVYSRTLPNGPTTLVSRADPSCSGCGNSNASAAIFAGSSSNGSKVFFETDEKLAPADEDGGNDVYQRSGSTTTLVSGGSSAEPANFQGASADGSKVFFSTVDSLAAGDTNGDEDVYLWSGGAPSLVTSGECCASTFAATNSDGSKVYYTTAQALVAGDTDSSSDVYQRGTAGGSPVLISAGASGCAPTCGNGTLPAAFGSATDDGSKVYFTSTEQLDAADTDSNKDVYLRDVSGGTTVLASPGGVCPVGGNCNVGVTGFSTDGTHFFFTTDLRLDPQDIDAEQDIYDREQGASPPVTRLVSTGNTAVLGPAAPELTGTTPASPAPSLTPAIKGQAPANTEIKVYTTSNCSGEVVATGTGAQLEGPGITVSVGVGSTTSFRATATDENGDASGCSNAVSYTQGESEEEEEPPPPPPPPPPTEEGGSGGTGGKNNNSGGSTKPVIKNGITYYAPLTRITYGPAYKTRKHKVVFRFVDSTGQPGSSFVCALERVRRKKSKLAWKACSSPKLEAKLRNGKYAFWVKGRNLLGTWEEHPVKRSFKVVGG